MAPRKKLTPAVKSIKTPVAARSKSARVSKADRLLRTVQIDDGSVKKTRGGSRKVGQLNGASDIVVATNGVRPSETCGAVSPIGNSNGQATARRRTRKLQQSVRSKVNKESKMAVQNNVAEWEDVETTDEEFDNNRPLETVKSSSPARLDRRTNQADSHPQQPNRRDRSTSARHKFKSTTVELRARGERRNESASPERQPPAGGKHNRTQPAGSSTTGRLRREPSEERSSSQVRNYPPAPQGALADVNNTHRQRGLSDHRRESATGYAEVAESQRQPSCAVRGPPARH